LNHSGDRGPVIAIVAIRELVSDIFAALPEHPMMPGSSFGTEIFPNLCVLIPFFLYSESGALHKLYRDFFHIWAYHLDLPSVLVGRDNARWPRRGGHDKIAPHGCAVPI
jgi:hypothetical protein